MSLKICWQECANFQNARQGRTGRQKLSASNMYVSVNSARLACGLAETDTAPTDFALPGRLSGVTVQATVNAGVFGFVLNCQPAYGPAVSVEAANGVPSGKQSTANSAYAPLTVLTSGLATSVDLSEEYQAVWGPQEVGAQIAVRLTAISAAGLRGVPYERVGIVAAASAAGAGETDEDMVLDAA